MMNIKEMDHTYIAPTYSRYNIVFEKGRGALLYDDSGGSILISARELP